MKSRVCPNRDQPTSASTLPPFFFYMGNSNNVTYHCTDQLHSSHQILNLKQKTQTTFSGEVEARCSILTRNNPFDSVLKQLSCSLSKSDSRVLKLSIIQTTSFVTKSKNSFVFPILTFTKWMMLLHTGKLFQSTTVYFQQQNATHERSVFVGR